MIDSKLKRIFVKKILTDEQIQLKEGEYFDESYYQNNFILKEQNVDVYKEENGELLLKVRRGVIPKEYTNLALEAFLEASKKKHENRGAAAGVLDRKKMPNYMGELIEPGKFRTKFKSSITKKMSKQTQSNLSPSNIVGYYDKPDRNLKGGGPPCRETAFTRDNLQKWNLSLSFLKVCDNLFKKLIPDKYKIQKERADKTPDFIIPDTAYSTVTINYSWRTGLHKDSGDLKDGFGNLIVIEDPNNENEYNGCYLGFPQYGVCVDLRTGDYLAMDVHEWHCNTEFIPKNNKISNKFKKKDIENGWHFNRLSLVMYLREKMIRCKDKIFSKKIKNDKYINIYKELFNNSSNYLNSNYIDKYNSKYQKYKKYILNNTINNSNSIDKSNSIDNSNSIDHIYNLNNYSLSLSDYSDTLSDYNDTLSNNSDTLSDYNDTLSNNSDILSDYNDTLSNNSDILSDYNDTLSNNSDILSDYNDTLSNNSDNTNISYINDNSYNLDNSNSIDYYDI